MGKILYKYKDLEKLSEAMSNSKQQGLIPDGNLERVRKRLLDLTARNRLLNLQHSPAQTVRIIDELPDQVYARLNKGNQFTLAAVPEPSLQELIDEQFVVVNADTGERVKDDFPKAALWAGKHGLNTAYELPASQAADVTLGEKSGQVPKQGTELVADCLRDQGPDPIVCQANEQGAALATKPKSAHADDKLQTLLFASELDNSLQKIHRLSKTAIEESGANILFLVLGFLEWYESRESDKPRLAPLFVLPVSMQRTSRISADGIRRYTLAQRDDGVLSNISLSARLLADFGIELPLLDDGSTPEDYFTQVTHVINRVDSRWTIRRFATLCLLDFTRQAMYQDLDPANWPAGKLITDHPLFSQFFCAHNRRCKPKPAHYLDEYRIDSMQNMHTQFPLIFDADSSQHNALIDVASGHNLVIEGAPGTGKSQTITNLIAACINQGKRVLFVAQKLAALEVVKRRLDEAGLGQYCLELHSHKSSKRQLLDSLVSSVTARAKNSAPSQLNAEIERYEQSKEALQDYAERMNTPWRDSGLTPHQILQRAIDFRECSPVPTDQVVVESGTPAHINLTLINQITDATVRLIIVFEAVAAQAEQGDIRVHYWYGLGKGELIDSERQVLQDSLTRWTNALKRFRSAWTVLAENLNQKNDPLESSLPAPELIGSLVQSISKINRNTPCCILERVTDLGAYAAELSKLTEDYHAYRTHLQTFNAVFLSAGLLDGDTAVAVKHSLAQLIESLGLSATTSIERIASHPKQISTLSTRHKALYESIDKFALSMPDALSALFQPSFNGLVALDEFMQVGAKLPPELWQKRDHAFDHPSSASLIEKLCRLIAKVGFVHRRLAVHFALEKLPSNAQLKQLRSTLNQAGFFGILKSDVRAAREELKSYAIVHLKFEQLTGQLSLLIRYKQGLEELERYVQDNPRLLPLYKGLDTSVKELTVLSNWYNNIRALYGYGNHARGKYASALIELNPEATNALVQALHAGLGDEVSRLYQSITKLQSLYSKHFGHNDHDEPLQTSKGGLQDLQIQVATCVNTLEQYVCDKQAKLADLVRTTSEWQACLDDIQAWQSGSIYQKFIPSLLEFELSPAIDDSHTQQLLEDAATVAQAASLSPLLANALQVEPSSTQLGKVIDACPLITQSIKKITDACAQFTRCGNVDMQRWLSQTHNTDDMISRNQKALDQPAWLDTWLSYQHVRKRLVAKGLNSVINSLERSEFQAEHATTVVYASLYEQLARHLLETDEKLAGFDGVKQFAMQQQFRHYDKNLLALQRQQIAWQCGQNLIPAGSATGNVADFSEFALIQHEAAKKSRHIAIRSLLSRANGAISALKPCFMMSPMSVAQYLAPGNYEFDLVVMDEASQIRPEEALGAIARAKQLVVVGDPKQLPPTSFFSRMADNDDDDSDDVELEQSESILDAVIPLFPTRRLRWHYRSRHESLISFSNHQFYDSNLILFPSPFAADKEFGVKFYRVPEGQFSQSTNLPEVDAVVNALCEQLCMRPQESVGVVAMNIRQRNAIEAQLEARIADDALFARLVEKNARSNESLFIKNWENVQGDERDVVIISMTYGPEQAGGVILQRFGPINSDLGWRGLNVLLTRARKRMQIYASFGSADVRVSTSSSRGIQSLHALLAYAETGHLHSCVHTDRPPQSAFELAVMRRLEAAGYTAETQSGIAGYFSHLAIRDPSNPARFLLALECDGVTYHSAKSAGDRDRLRQEVLENLGWKVRRIWSTDWYRNPDAQMRPLLEELSAMHRDSASD